MSNLTRRALGAAAIGIMVAGTAALAQTPPANPPVRVRGTIEKVDGNKLTVKNREGQELTITLADNVRTLALDKATIGDVKVGTYIGISSMPQPDGTLKALHVHIFPEAGRGTGEGHFPWDSRPGAMMTNAAVDTTVSGKDGQTLKVKYKDGGEKTVLVPSDAPIVKYVPGDKADLKPGVKIMIFAAQKQPDGSLTTTNIAYGVNGLTPPM
jgi:hypothetical protein